MGSGSSTQSHSPAAQHPHPPAHNAYAAPVTVQPHPVPSTVGAQSPPPPPAQDQQLGLHTGPTNMEGGAKPRSSSMAAQAAFVDPNHWVAAHLPGTITAKQFAHMTVRVLGSKGMKTSNSVACVSICRDEMCNPLLDAIQAEWGVAFNMSSLAGMLNLGKTGLKAAMHHAPIENGRERYVFLCFAHISVDVDGIGMCTRIGRTTRSNACGALCGFRSELKSGTLKTALDPHDMEFSLLKQELVKKIPYGQIPDLLEVTKMTAQIILEQLEQLLTNVDTKVADYAVCVGIQVHKHDGTSRQSVFTGYAGQYVDLIWPLAFYCVVEGKKVDLMSQFSHS